MTELYYVSLEDRGRTLMMAGRGQECGAELTLSKVSFDKVRFGHMEGSQGEKTLGCCLP